MSAVASVDERSDAEFLASVLNLLDQGVYFVDLRIFEEAHAQSVPVAVLFIDLDHIKAPTG